MRTSIFQSFTELPKAFREDFAILWEVPEEGRFRLIPHVGDMTKTALTSQFNVLVERAVNEIGGSVPDLLRVLKLLAFIWKEWNPMQDTVEGFRRDLVELQLIPKEKLDESVRFLDAFLSEVEKDNGRRLRKMFAISLLPSLESITTLVDFRAVFQQSFRMGDSLESYRPSSQGFVPVIIVKIVRDSGQPKTCEFQCEPQDVRIMIDRLQATLKELETAKLLLSKGF